MKNPRIYHLDAQRSHVYACSCHSGTAGWPSRHAMLKSSACHLSDIRLACLVASYLSQDNTAHHGVPWRGYGFPSRDTPSSLPAHICIIVHLQPNVTRNSKNIAHTDMPFCREIYRGASHPIIISNRAFPSASLISQEDLLMSLSSQARQRIETASH